MPVRRGLDDARLARWLLPLTVVAVVLGAAGLVWQLMHLRDEADALRRSTAQRARTGVEGAAGAGVPQERIAMAQARVEPDATAVPTPAGETPTVQALMLGATPSAGPASGGVRPLPAAPRPAPRVLENAEGGVPVTKCVGGGRTTYVQDGVCPAGQSPAAVRLRPLNTVEAPPRNAVPRVPAASAASVVRVEPAPVVASRPGAGVRDCVSLARQIERLDAQARQPHSGPEQDRLTERRRALRSRQAEWGC